MEQVFREKQRNWSYEAKRVIRVRDFYKKMDYNQRKEKRGERERGKGRIRV